VVLKHQEIWDKDMWAWRRASIGQCGWGVGGVRGVRKEAKERRFEK
jgi:hypothetical protein